MNEFDKCKFCNFYDEYEGCEGKYEKEECFCFHFDPDHEKIIGKARERHLSISDVVTLMCL